MAFLIVFLVIALVTTGVFWGLWVKEKHKRAIDKIKQDSQKKIDDTVEKETTARITELNRTSQNLSREIGEKERQIKEAVNRYNEDTERAYKLAIACLSLEDKYHNNAEDLSALQTEKEKLLHELKEIEKGIETEKPHLSELILELDKLKEIKRTALLENWKEDSNLWELPLSVKENELILILNRIKMDYPDIKVDISTIEWRKIWLPKLQDLGNREGLSCRGIYRLILKSDDKVCYVGQAVNIQDRWYQHVKKMIGADAKGNEKLYNYRPEDFYWTVVERGPQVDLNKSEKYWIEYFGCKEIGLNKKA